MIFVYVLLCINLIFLIIINRKINYIEGKVMDSGNKIEILWNEYLQFKHRTREFDK
jgi:hypothetical protein